MSDELIARLQRAYKRLVGKLWTNEMDPRIKWQTRPEYSGDRLITFEEFIRHFETTRYIRTRVIRHDF